MLSVGIMSELINLQVSGTMMHKIKCTDCTTLRKCNIIHQTGLKVFMIDISLYVYLHVNILFFVDIPIHHALFKVHYIKHRCNISNAKRFQTCFYSTFDLY